MIIKMSYPCKQGLFELMQNNKRTLQTELKQEAS